MLSSNTGRLTPPKIEVRCGCGKRYRVAATKAGKKVRCKNCRMKIEVPGGGDISMRTRKAVLEELGIDASAAEQAYEEEKRLAQYVCVFCEKRIPEEALKAAYGEHGLMCAECRVAQIQQRELGDPVENERKKQEKKKKLDSWATGSTPEEARRKALAYGALFFCGITGLLWSFSVSLWLAAAIAATVAFLGGRAIFNTEYTPEPVGADEDSA